MKKIKTIQSISLLNLLFDVQKLTDRLDPGVDYRVAIFVEEIESFEDEQYKAIINFYMQVKSPDENEEQTAMELVYILEFSSQDKLELVDLDSKEFHFTLFEIVEPYIRQKFNELTQQAKLSNLNFPYHFWELSQDDKV